MQQRSVPALFWEMENAMTATLASPSQGMGKVLQLSTLHRLKQESAATVQVCLPHSGSRGMLQPPMLLASARQEDSAATLAPDCHSKVVGGLCVQAHPPLLAG